MQGRTQKFLSEGDVGKGEDVSCVAVVRSVVFTLAMTARLMVLPPPSLVVASLDKMLYNNYSCLVESDQLQIKEVRSKNSSEKLGN